MRLVCCWTLIVILGGCAKHDLRCDAHLTPINPPAPAAAPADAKPSERRLAVSTEPELQAYFQESQSWDADRAAQQRHSARVAWWVAAAGWTCAVCGALALVILMPLKRVDPFVVRVDNTTGIVDVVPAYDGGRLRRRP